MKPRSVCLLLSGVLIAAFVSWLVYWYSTADQRRTEALEQLVRSGNIAALERELGWDCAAWLRRCAECGGDPRLRGGAIRVLGRSNYGMSILGDLVKGDTLAPPSRLLCMQVLADNGSKEACDVLKEIWMASGPDERRGVAKIIRKARGPVFDVENIRPIDFLVMNLRSYHESGTITAAAENDWGKAAAECRQIYVLFGCAPSSSDKNYHYYTEAARCRATVEGAVLNRVGNRLVLSGRVTNHSKYALRDVTVSDTITFLGPDEAVPAASRTVTFRLAAVLKPQETRAFRDSRPIPEAPSGRWDVQMTTMDDPRFWPKIP